jgi:spermidine synthase
MAARSPLKPEQFQLPISTRFLTAEMLPGLFQLPADIQLGNVEVNRLSHPVIVRYQSDWRWNTY